MLKRSTTGAASRIARSKTARGAAIVCALVAGLGVGIALAGSGGLDPSFGTGGSTVLTDPTSTYPIATTLAPSGRILVLSSAEGKLEVSRLLANGAPDTTFDGDGQAIIESSGYLKSGALAVQPDGKIVVVGSVSTASGEDVMVWRLKADGGTGAPNGALDPTFDTDGIAEVDSSAEDTARAVAIQPDGKIIVAGTVYESPGPLTVAVWRLKAEGGSGAINGALDPTFDTDGAAGVSDTTEDSVNAVALQPDGKIVVAGSTALSAHPKDAVVWRLKPNGGSGALNGALDPTFDTDGQADVESGGDESANAVAVQPDGKIVIAGYTTNAPHGSDAMVWRLKADGGSGETNGALDPTFDTDGAAAIDDGGYADASALAIQPDGRILVAGSLAIGTEPTAAVIWRLAENGGTGAVDGALDPTFGNGGAVATSDGLGASASAIALKPDRRIVAAGVTYNENLLVFRALGDPFILNVAKVGAGSGSVQSSPSGIACGAACAGPFDDGSQVTLTATPATGSSFAGWSSTGCSGAGACALTMNADQTVTAKFDPLPSPQPATHFVLKASQLRMKAFKRTAKSAGAVISGLPAGTKLTAALLAGRITLARASATAPNNGQAHLKFTFSRAARKRLRSVKLKTLTLLVTATPGGEGASKASKQVKLKRKQRKAHRAR